MTLYRTYFGRGFSRRLKCLAVIMLLAAPLSLSSQTALSRQQYEEGIQLYDNQEYEKAYNLFGKAALAGEADAWHMLGLMYAHGRGVKQDLFYAANSYRKGAEGGNIISQFNYGCYLREGIGVEKNPQLAVKMFELSSNQGWKPASYNLGIAYLKGDCGLKKDVDKAYSLISEAAQGEGGLPEAMYSLSVMWYDGNGCQRDVAGARQLMEIAASYNNPDANYTLGACYYDGTDVVNNEKDYEKALIYLAAFFEQRNSLPQTEAYRSALGDAMRKLSAMFRFGRGGVGQDVDTANRLLEMASDYGDADSAEVLEMLGMKRR